MESEPSRADARRLLAMHRVAPHLRRRVFESLRERPEQRSHRINQQRLEVNQYWYLVLELVLVLAAHSEHCKVRRVMESNRACTRM